MLWQVIAWIRVSLDVVLQRLYMLGLPPVDRIGGDVSGLTAVVTGPTSGIGERTAAALIRRGAHVVLACRSIERGEALRAKLLKEVEIAGFSNDEVEVQQLDLASLASVRAFAKRWSDSGRPLHILVNNAGVFAMTDARKDTEDGLELHMATNHLGHFLLTLLLLPALHMAETVRGYARVVNVASLLYLQANLDMKDPHLVQRSKYSSARAYSGSKLAQILFTRELRRRLLALPGPPSRIAVFALHPGMVMTDVVRSLPEFVKRVYRLAMTRILLSPDEGARASVWCASEESASEKVAITQGLVGSDCRPMTPEYPGNDDALALKLWEWSIDQVQLEPRDEFVKQLVVDR